MSGKESVLTQFRPETFDEVKGHPAVVNSLRSIVDRGSQSCFLFSGPAGTGKTTLALVTAQTLGVPSENIIEVDAASKSGVDDVRALIETAKTKGMFSNGQPKAIILDECARLSKNAWDAFLITLENGVEGTYWFFATTEPAKVPKTILTRCANFPLQPLSASVLTDLADEVCEALMVENTLPESMTRKLVKSAGGSARQLLTNLDLIIDSPENEDLGALLQIDSELPQAIDFCRKLYGHKAFGWKDFTQSLHKVCEQSSPETLRETILSYSESVILNSKDRSANAEFGLQVISALIEKWDYSQTRRQLLIRLADLIY